MSERQDRSIRYSQAVPPKVFRPVERLVLESPLRLLMQQLIQEEIVRRQEYYKLDTLLMRETRHVAYLGQAAIEKYAEALQMLAPESWGQPITAPVKDLTTDLRASTGDRRVVLKIEHPDELIAERERALAITRRMTGADIPSFTARLDITLGKLNHVVDNAALQNRLEVAVPQQITLLPTVIQTRTRG